jgi:hypothetical protein
MLALGRVGLIPVLDLALQKKVSGADSSLVLQVFVVGATRHLRGWL